MNKTGKSFGDSIISFYNGLSPAFRLPRGVEVMNPYEDPQVEKVIERFFRKFYSGAGERIFIFGINPGRFGAGITGISFTDPVNLSEVAGINHPFPMKPELSSRFVYEFIEAYGGLKSFCRDFFLTALCPLGFTKDGRNLNYYDDKVLEARVRPFILDTMEQQLAAGAGRELAICLGEGKNARYFNMLNDKYAWFHEVIALPHPRWIMQYRLRQKEAFINRYVEVLQEAVLLRKIK